MDFSEGVLFDPGYSKFALPFSPNIDAGYNMLLSIKSPHQRKFKFQILYPQFLKLLENTVNFYLGCLLWATFISRNFLNDPKEILENNFLGRDVEKLKKDCQYYLGKNCNIPNDWVNILFVYKDFLIMNNYLVDAQNTSDIKLPQAIKNISSNDLTLILEKIESVLQLGDLSKLIEAKDFIL